MTFGAYNDSVPKHFDLTIDGQSLERVEVATYLGIKIDYRLKWIEQIKTNLSKAKYFLFLFHNLKRLLTKRQLAMVYHGLFHSKITYGIIGWGGAYANILNQLQSLQNKILNIIQPNTIILNLRQTFLIDSLLLHYDTLRSTYINTSSVTRNKSIRLPKINKSLLKKSYVYTAINCFNAMPNSLKDTDISSKQTKKKFKKLLIHNIESFDQSL